jgi:hypothetical protein
MSKRKFIIEETHSYYKTVKYETFAETKEQAEENYNNDQDLTEISESGLNGCGVDFDSIYEEEE